MKQRECAARVEYIDCLIRLGEAFMWSEFMRTVALCRNTVSNQGNDKARNELSMLKPHRAGSSAWR